MQPPKRCHKFKGPNRTKQKNFSKKFIHQKHNCQRFRVFTLNNELFLLIKKHTDTVVEGKETRAQEKLAFELNEQWVTLSFYGTLLNLTPINLTEEKKWLLEVTSFETHFSVFHKPMRKSDSEFLHHVLGKKMEKDYWEVTRNSRA